MKKARRGANAVLTFLAMLLLHVQLKRSVHGDTATELTAASAPAEESSMLFEEYDFTRNPIVQDEVFFLDSKCVSCGFSILARSIEALLEQEDFHRAGCRQTEIDE